MRSSASTIVLAIFSGAVLGFGLSRVVLGGGSDDAVDSQVEAALFADPVEPVSRVDGQQQLAPAGAGGGSVSLADGPVVSEAEVARVTERVAARVDVASVRSAGAGDGVLSGTVTTEGGEPLPDVTVRIIQRPLGNRWQNGSDTSGAPPPQDLDAMLERDVRRQLERLAGLRETSTGADGTFRFDGLPDGRWAVEAHAEGWRIRKEHDRLSLVPTGMEVAFVAQRRIPVEFVVTDAGGAAVPEAVIQVRSDGDQNRTRSSAYAWTPDDRIVHLIPGVYDFAAYDEVLATRSGYEVLAAESAAEVTDVSLGADDEQQRVELSLARANGIWGHVSFESAPGGNSWPRLGLVKIGAEEDGSKVVGIDDQSAIYLDGGSAYGFMDVAPGRYVIAVVLEWGGEPTAREVVEFEGGVLRHDFSVAAVDADGERTFELEVLAPDGEPVRSIDTTIGSSIGLGGMRSSGVSTTFKGGVHVLTLPSDYDLSANGGGSAPWIDVSSSIYGSQRVQLSAGQKRYTVQFESPAFLEAVVGGSLDLPTGITLHVVANGEGEGGTSSRYWYSENDGSVDVDGHARLGPLAPGAYEVVLEAHVPTGRGWGGWTTVELEEVAVDLAAGDTRVELTAPHLYSLEVEMPGVVDNTWISLQPEVGLEVSGAVTTGIVQGEAVSFGAVTAGRYRLQDNASPPNVMVLTVPPERAVFAGSPTVALEVRIDDRDGRLAQMGLENGDRILGVDGSRVDTGAGSRTVQSSVWTQQGVFEFDVERGGASIVVEVDAGELTTRELGGVLLPVSD